MPEVIRFDPIRATFIAVAAIVMVWATVWAVAGLTAGPAGAQSRDGPSFNCRRASTPTEYLICDNPELARLDRDMASLYFSVYDNARGRRARAISDEQGRWLSERDRCSSAYDCVRNAYEGRIGELSVMADDDAGGHGTVGRPPPVARPPGGGRQSVWNHNGSEMLWTSRGQERVITYFYPRSGLPVAEGTVLFEGRRHGNRMSGTAYTFRRGCPPAGYRVEGVIRSETDVTLRGAAPVRARGGCRVVGHNPRSSNATLRFEYLYSAE